MTFDQTEISLTFSLTRDTLHVLLLRVGTSLVSEIEVTVLLYLYKTCFGVRNVSLVRKQLNHIQQSHHLQI